MISKVNNRNSRKNLRPVGKKNMNSTGRERQVPMFNNKPRSGSGEATERPL